MLTKTTVLSLLFAAAAGCENSSQLDTVPMDPYARPVESEPTVKVISVERLGDAPPEHPPVAAEAQARRYETVTRRRAQTSRFDVAPRDASSSVRAGAGEQDGTSAWPPAPESEGNDGEGSRSNSSGLNPGPLSETPSPHGPR